MRDPRHPFAIMLIPTPGAPPIIVASAADADQATITFHAELHRLRRAQVPGEVSVWRLGQDRPALLRVPLRGSEDSRNAAFHS